MKNTDDAFLGALAELLMQAGRDRAADALYAAMETEAPVRFTSEGNVMRLEFPDQPNAGQ